MRRFALIQGASGLAAIAALIAVLLQGPRFTHVENRIGEVHEQIVTLRLPPGTHAHVVTITRKGVMPGSPHHAQARTRGGRPGRAKARSNTQPQPAERKRPKMSRHTSHNATKRQEPRGKKRPRGYGQPITSAHEIMERLRTSPPRPARHRRPPGRVGSRP